MRGTESEETGKTRRALVVVDVQNDFLPGGSLAVPEGDKVIGPINEELTKRKYSLVVFTMDSHPKDHVSFASSHGLEPFTKLENGKTLWPDHCVADTPGSELHSEMSIPASAIIVKKGTKKDFDSYSCFFGDDGKQSTNLDKILKENEITDVVLCGLALDFCVKASALDALKLGYNTFIVKSATAMIDTSKEEEVIKELSEKGVVFL